MSTFVRQPFAPLDQARLHVLTSAKNRQNAISTSSAVKRKASDVDDDDFENVDPAFFSKRTKATDDFSCSPLNDFTKPSSFTLTKSTSSTSILTKDVNPPKPIAKLSRPRSFIQRSAVNSARVKESLKVVTTSMPTTPAGRSPTRGAKRAGISSRRRAAHFDTPSSAGSSIAPFSLDAAFKGTISSYDSTVGTKMHLRSALNPDPEDNVFSMDSAASTKASSFALGGSLGDSSEPGSWFFDIHEDTPEQEMTNLLQHSTCILDISSDEESEQRARRERAEGKDKENIPPANDVSQTTRARRSRLDVDEMAIDKNRGPLLEMDPADYYPEGLDGSSVFVIAGDEEEERAPQTSSSLEQCDSSKVENVEYQPQVPTAEFFSYASFDVPLETLEQMPTSIDDVMSKDESAKAAVLQPIEGTGESFELWESNSAKDAASIPASPVPQVVDEPEPEGVSSEN